MHPSDGRFADAIILAAGSSERMRGPDKLMLEVAGLPLLGWTLRAARAAQSVRRIIVVARDDRAAMLAEQPWIQQADVTIVVGGLRRQDSVACGFEASDGEVVLIHDGARPMVTPALLDQVAAVARTEGAAVPVVAVPESMRRIVNGEIVEILDRQGLYRSQTPHGARREVLHRAYSAHDPRGATTFIDETTLVQAAGIRVAMLPGEAANLKVTLPGDAELAIALLQARAERDDRARPGDAALA